MSACPRPGCEGEAPARGVFCPGCHFQIPRAYTSMIFRMKFAAERAGDDDTKKHLTEQTAAYVRSAVRIMGWVGGTDAAKS